MAKKVISIISGGTIFVSQEFDEEKTEPRMFRPIPVRPRWENIVEIFKGVRSVRAFESALEKAEELYQYKHIPVKIRPALPQTGEIWQMMDGELELFARYGKPVCSCI